MPDAGTVLGVEVGEASADHGRATLRAAATGRRDALRAAVACDVCVLVVVTALHRGRVQRQFERRRRDSTTHPPTIRVVNQNLLHGTACPPDSNRCDLPGRVALFAPTARARSVPRDRRDRGGQPRTVTELRATASAACGYHLVYDDDPGQDREVVLTTLRVARRRAAPARRAHCAPRSGSGSHPPAGPVDLVRHAPREQQRRPTVRSRRPAPPPCRADDTVNTCQARQIADTIREDPRAACDHPRSPATSTPSPTNRRSPRSPTPGSSTPTSRSGNPECDPATGAQLHERARRRFARRPDEPGRVARPSASTTCSSPRSRGVGSSDRPACSPPNGGPTDADGLVFPADHSGGRGHRPLPDDRGRPRPRNAAGRDRVHDHAAALPTISPTDQAAGHRRVHHALRPESRCRRAARRTRERRRAAGVVHRPPRPGRRAREPDVGADRLVRRCDRRHRRRHVLDPAQRRGRARRAARPGQARRRHVARHHEDLLPGRDPRRRHRSRRPAPDERSTDSLSAPARCARRCAGSRSTSTDGQRRSHPRRPRRRVVARATSARRAPRSATSTTIPTASASPMIRDGDQWREVDWDDAFARCDELLAGVIETHGKEAVTCYIGNPTAHNFSLGRYVGLFIGLAALPVVYSAGTVDQWPKNLTVGADVRRHVVDPHARRPAHRLLDRHGRQPAGVAGQPARLRRHPRRARRHPRPRRQGRRDRPAPHRHRRPRRRVDPDRSRAPTPRSCSRWCNVLFAEGLVDLGDVAELVDGVDAVRGRGRRLHARARRGDVPHPGRDHPPDRARVRRRAERRALRPHRHVQPGVRHARVVARRRRQHPHRQLRPARRADVRQPDRVGRQLAPDPGARRRRAARPVEVPRARHPRGARPGPGVVPRRGDRHARPRPDPRAGHHRRQPGDQRARARRDSTPRSTSSTA